MVCYQKLVIQLILVFHSYASKNIGLSSLKFNILLIFVCGMEKSEYAVTVLMNLLS